MTNRLADIPDDDILYVLQKDDVVEVAKEIGISKKSLTPEVILEVQKGIQTFFGQHWCEVIRIGLREALE